MRILYLVFTFYILYLVSMPCADKDMTCNHYSHQQAASNENHDDQTKDDSCSPFCVCSCCSVQVVLTNIVLYGQPPFTYRNIDLISDTSAENVFSAFVWQPPKVG